MGVSDTIQLPGWAAEMVKDARVARLGLLDEEGSPRVLPVTFALAGGRIWSAVDEKPKRAPGKELARVRFLRRDPRAALTVDRYSDDWGKLAWMQALGTMRIVEIDQAAETAAAASGLASLVAKYPPYRDAPPPGPLLALDPQRWLFWRARD